MTKITELTPILEGVSLRLPPPTKTEYDFRQILTTTPTHPATSALFRQYTLLLSYLLASFPQSSPTNNDIPTLATLASRPHPHYTAELDVQILQIEKRFDQLSSLIPASISLHDGTTTTLHNITWSSPPPCTGFADAVKNSLRAKLIELFNPQGEKLFLGVHYNNDHWEQDFLDRAKRLSKEILNLEEVIEELLTLEEGTLEIVKGEVGFAPDVLGWRLAGTRVEGQEVLGDARKLRREVATTEAAAADCNAIVRVNTLFSSAASTSGPYNQSFTGWLIDKKTVVTTGAAVYNHSHGFASAVEVVTNNKKTYQGTHCGVHWGFFIGADRSFSLGVIRLDREVGDAAPLKPRNPPFRGENITVTIRGFLSRLEHQRDEVREGTTEAVCNMERNQRLLDHDVAVTVGSLGSPVIDQGGYVIGMHEGRGYDREDQRVNKALTFDPFSNRPAAFKVALDFMEDPLSCMDKIAGLEVKPMRTEEMRNGLCRIQFRGWTKWYKGDI